jgi:formate--tetrahydrofolate ligase
MQAFNLPVVVAINYFAGDTPEELDAIIHYVERFGAKAVVARHWAEGGQGAEDLARSVLESMSEKPKPIQLSYQPEDSLFEKIEAVASRVYRANEVLADTQIREQLKAWENEGYGHFPVCIAKTQYSFTTDPDRRGAPLNHSLVVRDVHLSAGAGFIVVVCGNIMRMPGLPRQPAAEKMRLNNDGLIEGLF